jgi:Rrf2 family protein
VIFSSKAEYGVRLMVELGRQTPERPTSLKAIADVEGLPLAYLEQVVARQPVTAVSAPRAHDQSRLLESRDPAEITMFDVVGALEGAIAPMECFVHDEMERVVCSHVGAENARSCATKLLWTRVQGGIARSLQTTTLAELVEFSRRNGEPAVSKLSGGTGLGANVAALRIPPVTPATEPRDHDPAPAAA